MNAPLPDHVLRALEKVTLDDKYALDNGRAFMSGVQALVRLPMLQRTRDAIAGLNTAGFVSGYRGSPLGGYDQALMAAKKHLAKQNIVFQPGVNEELGATAVWGTQQLELFKEKAKFDGVFGIWYGKGPGVDRCIDVFKHANMAGTSKHGGVIAIAGDDHIAKSSTAAHQSDHVFKAAGFPVFFPSSVQDILDMGLHAFAMSRFSGLWSGMKTIQEIVESGASVSVDPDRVNIITPDDFPMPPGGLHIRWPDPPLDQEARMLDHKWYAALAYVRANKLNYNVIATPNDRLGLIASGKAWNDTRQALHDLGLDDDTCRRLGIRLHKVNVVWPLEANITRDFATRPAGDPGHRGKAPGHRIPDQGAALQLALRRAPACAGQVRRRCRRRHGWRVGPAQPQQELAAAPAGRPNPGHHRPRDRQAPEEAGRGCRCGRPPGRPRGPDRRQGKRPQAGRESRRWRRPHPLVLLGLPAQHQHPRARGLARRGRHRLPLHGHLDAGPQHRHLHPDGWRGRALGRPGRLHQREAHLLQPR